MIKPGRGWAGIILRLCRAPAGCGGGEKPGGGGKDFILTSEFVPFSSVGDSIPLRQKYDCALALAAPPAIPPEDLLAPVIPQVLSLLDRMLEQE